MTDLDRETLASDVLENWTPPETDTHPDDCPRAFDDDGAPILRCPMAPASNVRTMMMGRTNGRPVLREVVPFDGARVETSLESGAIEGAGGTWWVPKSTAWSVEPSRIRALSPRGRAWLKATLARAAHAHQPGETDQRTAPLSKACKSAAKDIPVNPGRWIGADPLTGEVVLRLHRVDIEKARAIIDAYGVAGRPLTLRPA